jgi:methyl-accepting chemotaxis protein
MTVRARITLLIGSVSFFIILLGADGVYSLNQTVQGLRTVYLDRVVPLRDLKDISDAYAVSIVDAAHKVRNGNITSQEGLREITNARTLIQSKWTAYLSTFLVDEEQAVIRTIRPLMDASWSDIDTLERIIRNGQTEALDRFVRDTLYQVIDPISNGISQLISVQVDVAGNEYRTSSSRYDTSMIIFGLILALSLLVSSAQAYSLVRFLRLNLGAEPKDLRESAEKIASGDLRPSNSHASPMGVLAEVEVMRSSLNGLVGDITIGSEQIEAATLQLATSAQQVMAGSSQQSNVASSMAASMEELSVSISQIAENAKVAEGVALSVKDNGLVAFSMVESLVQEIKNTSAHIAKGSDDVENLASQSHKINSIVEVIRGIAEQTNLLALNAAIEAARAGEQGRGFAVVADEVRNLAARTAQSTSEIVELVAVINESVDKAKASMRSGCSGIESGNSLVEKTGNAMRLINAAVVDNLDAVAAIAHSLEEQRIAVDDVARNVEVVAHIVEENSEAQAGISESADSLRMLTDDLRRLTRKFTLHS